MFLLFVSFFFHIWEATKEKQRNRIESWWIKSERKPDMGGASCFYITSNEMTLNQRTLNNTICCGIFVVYFFSLSFVSSTLTSFGPTYRYRYDRERERNKIDSIIYINCIYIFSSQEDITTKNNQLRATHIDVNFRHVCRKIKLCWIRCSLRKSRLACKFHCLIFIFIDSDVW